MKYYEVVRTRTAKAIGQEDYQGWDKETKQFQTIAEIKSFLKEEYGECKKTSFYYDDKQGVSHKAGNCYHYKTPPANYGDKTHYNIDWVEVREINATIIVVK